MIHFNLQCNNRLLLQTLTFSIIVSDIKSVEPTYLTRIILSAVVTISLTKKYDEKKKKSSVFQLIG